MKVIVREEGKRVGYNYLRLAEVSNHSIAESVCYSHASEVFRIPKDSLVVDSEEIDDWTKRYLFFSNENRTGICIVLVVQIEN